VSKGNLLLCLVFLTAFAAIIASLGGGFVDGG
jgi:hypothetical protein